jgi:hypothetical protein
MEKDNSETPSWMVLLLWIIATTIIFNVFNSCLGICFHKSINTDGDVPTLEEVK